MVEGGPSVNDRLYGSLERAGISHAQYRANKIDAERTLVSQRLLLPLYLERDSTHGQRWENLFQMLENTDEHQTIIVPAGQILPPDKLLSLPKTGYLLHAKRWPNQQEKLSVREAIEQRLTSFYLEDVKDVSDVPVGIDFQGISKSSNFNVTSPFNWIRGRELYKQFGSQAKVSLQFGGDNLYRAIEQGIIALVRDVPSIKGTQSPHIVRINNIPVYFDNQGPSQTTKAIGYDLITSDTCERSTFSGDSFSRKIKPAFSMEERLHDETEFDHHSDFVLRAAVDAVPNEYIGMSVDYPFPELRSGVEEIADEIFKRVMITRGNNGKIERKMLSESVVLKQIVYMMAIAHVNSKNRKESASTAA